MDRRAQLLVLAGVVGAIAFGVKRDAGRLSPVGTPASSTPKGRVAHVAPAVDAVAVARDTIADADSALRINQVAIDASNERTRLEAVDREQQAAAIARREAAAERVRKLREAARANVKKAFDDKLAAMERENAELIGEAINREDAAIKVSHATLARRNSAQWKDYSDFLSGHIRGA